ncbi:hypothetical protein CRV08_11025 [Halarcobacter ebronensis]|uniref:General glycosylation pathway protein n=1 Tax=Halarcobacter ebronensis TaxID=1462615 RepID=A0A4Q0Y9Z8_9BACT|nr:hypothetical protein [Halarcobacter ebronensis]QKF83201.1 putative membrane protein [Halarcobacter ebronensis]RXJ67117.1 hypothetical protein CRV08_11025 [Halarcobacter ebronensis]RXK05163.1 hypothetical protein CRV07_09105 [Halarcobacter ebronensis]
MKEYLEVYFQNQDKIEDFLQESLLKLGELKRLRENKFKEIFSIFPSLELVYIINKDTKIQISPNFYRNSTDTNAQNISRDYLLSKLHFKENSLTAFSTPYVSSATKSSCVTVSVSEGNYIIFFDFKIESLLERMNLIELNKPFHTMTKTFYTIAGYSMFLLALFIVFYSIYDFIHSFAVKGIFDLDTIFKPIIALTLGVAIFDLGKTILEQEVYFKSYSKNSKVETKMITKFLISIIIALSIEGLMVVFKIAINDYDKMINALYLITGISFILIALSIFIYLTRKK